jgi:hypothetical protein
MHKNVRLTLRFLSTIRYYLAIRAVMLLSPVSCELANWIGEQSGLNDALRACLAESDRREARAEPLAALPVKSVRAVFDPAV